MFKIISFANIKHAISKNKKKFYTVAIIFFCIVAIVSFLRMSVNPIIVGTIEARSKSISTRAMNSAIADVVMNSIVYDDLVNIVTDDLGNILMIQANALEINNLSKDLAQTTEKRIEEYGGNGVLIPLGSFTGIPMLVGRGPNIKIKVQPIGAVFCSFVSKFENAGINQTNHKIYLNVVTNLGIVMPLMNVKFLQEQQVLISESIIVGQVPEVYLYSDNLDTLLNFVPY